MKINNVKISELDDVRLVEARNSFLPDGAASKAGRFSIEYCAEMVKVFEAEMLKRGLLSD